MSFKTSVVSSVAPSDSIGSTIVPISRREFREIQAERKRRYERELECELARTPLERLECALAEAKEIRAAFLEKIEDRPSERDYWRPKFEQADRVVAELVGKITGLKAREAQAKARSEAAAARAEEAARQALVRDAEVSRRLHQTVADTSHVLDRMSGALAVDRAAIAERAYWSARAKTAADLADEQRVLELLLGYVENSIH